MHAEKGTVLMLAAPCCVWLICVVSLLGVVRGFVCYLRPPLAGAALMLLSATPASVYESRPACMSSESAAASLARSAAASSSSDVTLAG